MNHFQLSQKDANSTLELIHSSLSCYTVNAFLKLVECLKYLIGFDHALCIYGDVSQHKTKGKDAFIPASIFPQEWIEHYFRRNYIVNDTVVHAAIISKGLQYWDDARQQFGSVETAKVDQDAKAVGLKDGWVYAMGQNSSPSFAYLSHAGERVENSDRCRTILEHVLPHMAESLKRVCLATAGPLTKLTQRETEILSWLMVGKTAWEISVILSISQRTVEFHINNVIKKLDASNARHAVAIAAAEGIAIP